MKPDGSSSRPPLDPSLTSISSEGSEAALREMPVRHPRIKLSDSDASEETETSDRYWWGGDPFKTHFLNAFSSTLPFGESFFVRSVRHYADQIAEGVDDPRLMREIRAFAGQEGQHSRLHDEHVEILISQGYGTLATRNRILDRIMRWQNRKAPRLSLALTASLEHLTAILARQILRDSGRWTADMTPAMGRLWRWHALEEAEHKSVAFDVLSHVAPSRALRAVAMVLNTFELLFEVLVRMSYMLWTDGLFFKASLWIGGFRFLYGRGGFLRGVGADYRAWYGSDFHPDDIDDHAMIREHAGLVEAEIRA